MIAIAKFPVLILRIYLAKSFAMMHHDVRPVGTLHAREARMRERKRTHCRRRFRSMNKRLDEMHPPRHNIAGGRDQ